MRLVTAPAEYPVTLADVKAHCRVDDAEDDALLMGFVAAVVAVLDGNLGLLNRALISQTWEMKFDKFPTSIELPLPPTLSITSIDYIDTDGAPQSLDTADYFTTNLMLPMLQAQIWPAKGKSWPTVNAERESVTVKFVAGFGAAPSDVPEHTRAMIKMMVDDLYENRETTAAAAAANESPAFKGLRAASKFTKIV